MASNRVIVQASHIEDGNYLIINNVMVTDAGKIAAATELLEYPDVKDWTIHEVDTPARVNITHYSDLTVDSQTYDTDTYANLTSAQQDCVDVLIA